MEVPPRSGIMGSLLALLMSYYVFDLKIPPRHAMALSVFQAIVLEEPPSGTLPQSCLFFMKKVRSAIEQLPAASCPEWWINIVHLLRSALALAAIITDSCMCGFYAATGQLYVCYIYVVYSFILLPEAKFRSRTFRVWNFYETHPPHLFTVWFVRLLPLLCGTVLSHQCQLQHSHQHQPKLSGWVRSIADVFMALQLFGLSVLSSLCYGTCQHSSMTEPYSMWYTAFKQSVR